MFSSALQSGQLAPLMGQFGFNDDVMGAASRGGTLQSCLSYGVCTGHGKPGKS